MRSTYLGVFLTPLFLFLGEAHGEIYPWTEFRADDVRVLRTFKSEVNVRMEMIKNAKQTLDIVVFEQGFDKELGLPIASELRKAADRGVKVRLLANAAGGILFDSFNRVAHFLVDVPTKNPIEFILFGRGNAVGRGWGRGDGPHQKMMIVDKNIMLTTGRSHSSLHFSWLDTGFIFKGDLVNQAIDTYEKVWSISLKEDGLQKPGLVTVAKMLIADPNGTYPLSKRMQKLSTTEKQVVEEIITWTTKERDLDSPVAGRVRTLYHNFLQQMLDADLKLQSIESRTANLRDDILETMLGLIEKSKRIRFTTLSLNMHPLLDKVLEKVSKESGKKIEIQTNSSEAIFYWLDYLNFQFVASIESLTKVVGLSHVKVFGLVPMRAAGFQEDYLHRKLGIFDDTVVIGSHNLTLPSTIFNDEVSFEIESPMFAQVMGDIFDEDGSRTSMRLSKEIVESEDAKYSTKIKSYFAPLLARFF